MKTSIPAPTRLSVRIDFPDGTRFGPGKAALLEAIHNAGSITAAAMQLGMSYPRALKLVDQMNSQFAAPMIDAQHGGASRGGATITPLGQDILRLYRALIETADQTTREIQKDIARRLE